MILRNCDKVNEIIQSLFITVCFNTSYIFHVMESIKQEFLVMVNMYLFLQHSDPGVKATWPIT